jgi:CheY-like chemotaxis protein
MVAVATKRILAIDSDRNTQNIVRACLQKLGGWEVIIASSACEGLVKAELELPDAILLEGMMFDLDAATFLQRLRANPKTQSLPVIFLTKQPNLTERQQFLQLGASGAIAKPFDPLTLVGKIAETLGWTMESYQEIFSAQRSQTINQ